MQRDLFRTRIEAHRLADGKRVSADLQLAASNASEAVADINAWCVQNGLQIARHGELQRLRKARRQEQAGIQFSEVEEAD